MGFMELAEFYRYIMESPGQFKNSREDNIRIVFTLAQYGMGNPL